MIKLFYLLFFWVSFLLIRGVTFLLYIFPIKYLFKVFLKQNKNILYLDPFSFENAGTEYRINKWAEKLMGKGFSVSIKRTFSESTFKKLQSNKEGIIVYQMGCIIIRFFQIILSIQYKTVIVRRTLLLYNDYGNGTFMEHFLVVLHPNVIFDFDDDMTIQNRKNITLFGKLMLENLNKFYSGLAIYERFIAGSEYLKILILKNNKKALTENIIVVPTCVDYEKYPKKNYSKNLSTINFGWIGTAPNTIYLDQTISALNKASKTHQVKLIIISNIEYKNEKAEFKIENRKWSLSTEIQDLLDIDIGIMPLFETNLEKGKCGFKLIQYMGLGIVSIASAITVNKEIIDDGINGFLVYDRANWENTILNVLNKKGEFEKIGEQARKKISLKYSFNEHLFAYYLHFVSNNKTNPTIKDKIRPIVRFFTYYVFFIFIKKCKEKTRDNTPLLPGISVVVSAKNEETVISLALKSLIGFADQIICIDNGSDDSTYLIMKKFQVDYHKNCNIELVSMPTALLGECRDEGLKRSKHQWHLRWDADMIFKTSGNESASILREMALNTKRSAAFLLPRVNLFGDFKHTAKTHEVIENGELFLVKLSKDIKYIEDGRFDIIKIPIYYDIIRLNERFIFHCDGIKPNLRLIYRNLYFDWRETLNSLTDKNNSIELEKYKLWWEKNRYKTNDKNELIYRHQRETLLQLKKYDTEIYSEYPEIIIAHIEKKEERFNIIYRDGKPYLRTDKLNPEIESYTATKEDAEYNPLEYLMKILPKNYHYKLL